MTSDRKMLWGLLRRRSIWWPTWKGWICALILVVSLMVILVRCLHGFLAVNAPLPADTLVVEGWLPDYALAETRDEFRRLACQQIYVTGGPLQKGSYLITFTNYARLGAATLMELGLGSNEVTAVPAPFVQQDRTYTSAVALRHWFQAHQMTPRSLQIVSLGPHARRSRLLFETAFGGQVDIGIIAIENQQYDPAKWYQSSEGVRATVGEFIAYIYARFLFHPKQDN